MALANSRLGKASCGPRDVSVRQGLLWPSRRLGQAGPLVALATSYFLSEFDFSASIGEVSQRNTCLSQYFVDMVTHS